MSRERESMTPRPRHTFTVVPAKAGTHNRECCLLRDVGATALFNNTTLWL